VHETQLEYEKVLPAYSTVKETILGLNNLELRLFDSYYDDWCTNSNIMLKTNIFSF
jgi:hypothetical protein